MPPVYGFVNGVQLEREPASAPMLKDWRDAGFPLGNHTWSHMNLNTSSLADWEADLAQERTHPAAVRQQTATGTGSAIRSSPKATHPKNAPTLASTSPLTDTRSRPSP